MVQINEYEIVLYFLQISQNLIWDCLLISVYLPVFANVCMICSWNCFVLYCRTILGTHHAKTGKIRYIHKNQQTIQCQVLANWIKYGAVSYSLSCNKKSWNLKKQSPPLYTTFKTDIISYFFSKKKFSGMEICLKKTYVPTTANLY